MRPRWLRSGSLALVAVVLGCSPAPSPSPSVVTSPSPPPPAEVTPPPIPEAAVPWPDIVWTPADGVGVADPADGEQVVAVAAGPDGFVAVGFREANAVRDGRVWTSPDGSTWTEVDQERIFDGVELVDVAAVSSAFVAVGVEIPDLPDARPRAVFLRSVDGRAWERLGDVPGAADSFPAAVTGGALGVLAAGTDADGRPILWRSPDGRKFERIPIDVPASDQVIDPHAVDGGFVALGSGSGPPTLLRSTDASDWTATGIDPASDMTADRIVPGRWGYVVQGLSAGGCPNDIDCGGQPVGWWSKDGISWGRLPADGSPISNGGSIVIPAGIHGFVAVDGASAWSSLDGWAWRPLPEPGDGSMVVSDAVVDGDTIVAVGAIFGEDGISRGAIVVAR
jgi:hypothetical protein